MSQLPTIPEFFTGKRILLTGGTGFIGKVFIEKLLRSCPDIDSVYLLMRSKKQKTVEERIKAITDLPLFDGLRKERPECFKKIKIITGDIRQSGLGLSDEDRQLLINEINLIYHAAASVRFDDTLTDAILLNTRGTREMAELALEMKNIELFFYVSTAYCHCDQKVIKEELYPAKADWRQAIKIAERLDKKLLNIFTEKYMKIFPNTYTFSKSLAENVVDDLLNGKIPVIIERPSIVISTHKEPFPGWIDNFNGPVGILAGCGKGIVRTMYVNPDILADYIPVDVIVKGMILSTWHKLTGPNPLDVSVFNACNNNFKSMTFREITEFGKTIAKRYPLEGLLWYPGGGATYCWYNFYLKFIFYQLIPAVIIDTFLKVLGYEPLLLKIQRRIYSANLALEHFVMNQWTFINEKGHNLELLALPCDHKDYNYFKEDSDPYKYFTNAALGAKRYLFKEFDDEAALRHAKRMYYISKIFNIVWYLILFWILYAKLDILGVLGKKFNDIILYLTTD